MRAAYGLELENNANNQNGNKCTYGIFRSKNIQNMSIKTEGEHAQRKHHLLPSKNTMRKHANMQPIFQAVAC